MHPKSGQLLRAIADLAAHAQAKPTDNPGIGRLRKARVQAENAWINEGCPDLPHGGHRPHKLPKAGRRVAAEEMLADKDWEAVTVTLTVRKLSGGGVLLSDDGVEAWVPQKLCWEVGTRKIASVQEDDVVELDMPQWLVEEKGFHV
jgi:hypothetical protein